MSLKAVMVFYASSIAFLFLLALLFPAIGYSCAHMGSMLLVAMSLHALIVPFKGVDFVIWDAPPDSPVKYYWFLRDLRCHLGGNGVDRYRLGVPRIEPKRIPTAAYCASAGSNASICRYTTCLPRVQPLREAIDSINIDYYLKLIHL